MANFSSALSGEVKWELFKHTIYIIQGCANIILNSLIVITIARHEALRSTKEYFILGAAALADVGDSLAPVSAGLYRIPIWLNHNQLSPASRRFCLLTPHSMFWSWSTSSSQAMLVVLSLDRVLSLAKPLEYHSRKYAVWMVSVAYGMSFAVGAFIYVTQWPNTQAVHTKICWTSYAYSPELDSALNTLLYSLTLLSIGLYLLVPILFRFKQNNVEAMGPEAQANGEFQKQLNKAVSLSCLFTFVSQVLPRVGVWLLALGGDHQAYDSASVWMAIFARVDPMVNLYIYYKKQKYFRKGFKALFENKTLPMALNQW